MTDTPKPIKDQVFEWGYDSGSFKAEFPEVWEAFDNGRRLPAFPDRAGLFAVCEWADANEPNEDGMYFTMDRRLTRFFLNRELRNQGRKEWPESIFEKIWDEYGDQANEKEQAEMELAKRDAARDAKDWLHKRTPGRRRSVITEDAIKISLGCGLSRDRAYRILRSGSGDLETRKKLARIFTADPERNFPAAWELKAGRSWGKPPPPNSFKVYCLSMVDEFEGDADTVATLATLRELYKQGRFPPTFKSGGDLLERIVADRIDLDPATVLGVWGLYQRWQVVNS